MPAEPPADPALASADARLCDDAILMPNDVRDILHRGVRSDAALRIRGRLGNKFDYYNILKIGEYSSLISRRTISFDKSFVRHHLINKEVHDDEREAAAAVGVTLIRNALCLYKLLGIPAVTLRAGLSVGGALWPKLGFIPVDAASWQAVVRHVREKLTKLPIVYRRELSSRIEITLGNPNERLIFSISGLTDRLPPDFGTLSLGDYLLGGSRWEGVLRLEDSLAREQYQAYFSRKRLDSVDSLVSRWRNGRW